MSQPASKGYPTAEQVRRKVDGEGAVYLAWIHEWPHLDYAIIQRLYRQGIEEELRRRAFGQREKGA